MKKSIYLSLMAAVVLSAEILPGNIIGASSLAQENGGAKAAIDAYTDGGGAIMIGSPTSVKMDNSEMNGLVFKFGEVAKKNNAKLYEQVLTLDPRATAQEKVKADVLQKSFAKRSAGRPCNDGESNTINDMFINGSCIGKTVTAPTCIDPSMIYKTSTKSCEKGGTSTHAATSKNNFSCTDGGTLSGTTCLKSSTYAAVANNSYSCPSGGSLSGSTCTTTTTFAATRHRIFHHTTYSCYAPAYKIGSTTCAVASTYEATNNVSYSCPSGGTLSGSTCTIPQNYPAANTLSFSCPTGETLNGTTCSANTLVIAPSVCQSGYTMMNNSTCVQN